MDGPGLLETAAGARETRKRICFSCTWITNSIRATCTCISARVHCIGHTYTAYYIARWVALGGWLIIALYTYTECNHITSILCKSQFLACKICITAKSDYISAFESALFLHICMPFCKSAFLQICFSTNLAICFSANLAANLPICFSANLLFYKSANLLF